MEKARGRSRWRGAGLLAAVLLLALAAHHNAYRGWFEDDDLSTLTWAGQIPLRDLIFSIPSLQYPGEHSRPAGYFYYDAISRCFGLDYPPYVAVLQLVCVLNVGLLWLLLRRIGLDALAAAAGCLFFAMHRALFDAWWKPMFVYDVLCTTFALASVVAWAYRRWVLSFIAFWLAMRSKEVGIVLPGVLLWYEMTLGKRNWKAAIPFFLPAAIYGVRGFLFNLQQQSLYTFHFNAAGLWTSARFYFDRLLRVRYAGFAFLALPWVVRDRRIYFGIGALVFGLAIYLILPGRLLEVYLYLAMTGAAVAIGALTSHQPRLALAVLLIWTGWQYLLIRRNAVGTLAAASERQAYVDSLRQAADSAIYIYDRIPASMHSWGVEGALHLFHHGVTLVHRLEDSGLPAADQMILLDWDGAGRHLAAEPFTPATGTYIDAGGTVPGWQLRQGWHPPADGYRQIDSLATARLYRPEGVDEFEWDACGDGVELRTVVAGEELSRMNLHGCGKGSSKLQPAAAGIVGVQFLTNPPDRTVKIGRLGFLPH